MYIINGGLYTDVTDYRRSVQVNNERSPLFFNALLVQHKVYHDGVKMWRPPRLIRLQGSYKGRIGVVENNKIGFQISEDVETLGCLRCEIVEKTAEIIAIVTIFENIEIAREMLKLLRKLRWTKMFEIVKKTSWNCCKMLKLWEIIFNIFSKNMIGLLPAKLFLRYLRETTNLWKLQAFLFSTSLSDVPVHKKT